MERSVMVPSVDGFEFGCVRHHAVALKIGDLVYRFPIFALRPSTFRGSVYSVLPLFMSFLIWNPIAASAAVPTCVVKLKFSSDDKSDSATNAFVKKF